MLQKVLSLWLLSLAGVAAKRPGQVWIMNLNDGFRQLFEGDRTTMADFFSPDARVCFNSECGGPEYFDQFSLTSDFTISSHHELSEEGFVSYNFDARMKRDACEAPFKGNNIMYLTEENKIKEMHMYTTNGFDDWTMRLKFVRKCGDAARKYKEFHSSKEPVKEL